MEAEQRSRKHRILVQPFHDLIEAADVRQANPLVILIRRDLIAELFGRLGETAPDRLRILVKEWANRWQESETIPLLGQHRRRRTELRALAAKVLKQLARPGG